MAERHVFKVQRPLMTNAEPCFLIYNEARDIEGQIPVDNCPDVLDLFADGDLKVYVHGTYDPLTGLIHIEDTKLDPEDW